jgi:hypothetical protein
MHIECTSPSFPQLITQNTSQTCQSLQNKDGDVCQCPQCHWIGREDDPPRLPNGVEKESSTQSCWGTTAGLWGAEAGVKECTVGGMPFVQKCSVGSMGGCCFGFLGLLSPSTIWIVFHGLEQQKCTISQLWRKKPEVTVWQECIPSEGTRRVLPASPCFWWYQRDSAFFGLWMFCSTSLSSLGVLSLCPGLCLFSPCKSTSHVELRLP